MSTFPTSSTHILELRSERWDIAQTLKVIEEKIKDGVQTESSTRLDDSLLHLHTLTLDATLLPPPELIEYFRRNLQPNPAYEVYLSIRDKVCTSVDPLVPITLSSFAQGQLRNPADMALGSAGRQLERDGQSVNFYLPNSHIKRPLILFPTLPAQVAKEWMVNSQAWGMQHWLQAVISLDPSETSSRPQRQKDDKERFVLQTRLQVLWLPGEDGGTDLKFLVTVELLANMENILNHPLADSGGDMIGLILHSIIPTFYPSPQLSESEARAAGLKRFFDGLNPAPDHPITYNVKALQPEEMQCRLLPFQARTVGFLLRREGSMIVPEVKPLVGDPEGFWQVIGFGSGYSRVAYRRATGSLIHLSEAPKPDRKGKGKAVEDDADRDGLLKADRDNLPHILDLSSVKGTMLCEEMGKTVEAIALTLLNRHPLSARRPHHSANSGSSVSEDSDVPKIDFAAGVPDIDTPVIRDWVMAEQAAFEGKTVYDEISQLNVTEVAATLIITPPSLLKQWVSEIRRHAPYLRVCVYEGWKSLERAIQQQHHVGVKAYKRALENKKRKVAENFRRKTVNKYQRLNAGTRVKTEEDDESEDDTVLTHESSLDLCQRQFVEYVRAHDIVITTYNNLADDLKVALPAPPRARRSNANYQIGERPRSPLMMIDWWRVIMDEVQLHSDSSRAAEMVAHIPRVHALAMSGTPAKTSIGDLVGSLKFLRVPVLPYNPHIWHRLQQAAMQEAFYGIFSQIANRFVVPIELSEIELHYYNDTFDRQRELLHLPDDLGEERPADWHLDKGLFNQCFRNLRQICTHIQVGQMNQQQVGRGPRLHLGRNLMTMAEALKKMCEDHTQEFMVESRVQMRAMIRRGQLMILDEHDETRHLSALTAYQGARDKVDRQIGSVRDDLQRILDERTAKEIELDEALDTPPRLLSQHERERSHLIFSARTSLRELLIILHQTWFFEGDVQHVLKNEALEVECYSKADALRKEILVRPLQMANKSVDRLQAALDKKHAVDQVSDLQVVDTDMRGGLFTAEEARQANELLKILNGNAELLFAWRRKIIDLLSSPIDTEGDPASVEGQGTDVENPEAEFYAQGLQAQGDVEAFLIAYAAVVADRKEFLSEDRRNLLAEHDGRVKKLRTTKAAQNALLDAETEVLEEVKEQTDLLMAERQAFRLAREEKGCTRPLRGILMDLHHISLGEGRPEERAIARMLTNKIKTYIAEQMDYQEKLAKELEIFRAVFNIRVKYFSALQEISDSVTAPQVKNLREDIDECHRDIIKCEVRLTEMTRKGRYLQYLYTRDPNDEDLREDCIICMGSSDDKNAVVLDCGHFFCRSCYKELRRARTRQCPSCRVEINDRAITHVKLQAEPAKEETLVKDAQAGDVVASGSQDVVMNENGEVDPHNLEEQRRAVDLNKIKYLDMTRMREIAHLDILGEYGSKITFLIKHLLWYKVKEPDARHVIFSNWSDSLNIVVNALKANDIRFVSFDQGAKNRDVVERFKNDPTITVFLLHAEKESSGLTLTSCRVVHLLEPVLQHSFELQAIGRVDRLGQEKETTVFCYATKDTVESRILSQGVRNGTSIYLKDEARDERVADMPNVASAAHKGGDMSNGNEEELLKLIL